ncbi:MAG: SiaB family protein kinase [bacterium]|nr:SiaB family protein kinase [bacterium]
MNETINTIGQKIRALFKETHDALVNEENRKILVSHNGTFSQDLVGSLSNGVEELLVSKGDKRIVIKRMFSILLEGLQNIRLHGRHDEKGEQLAFLVIAGDDESYKVHMANIIENSEVQKIESYLEELNAYEETVLKEKYLAVLSNEFMSAKGGAGLGLITTRMKSGPLGHRFSELSEEQSLFVLEVTLPRIKR